MAAPQLNWRIPTRLDVLQEILSQYPDDGQILKEILQNAEDAGARRVKFIYDKHEYSADGLDPKLAKFQGPSLYAFNDANFENEDFENLLNIQHSSKREDRTKVGRFGRGFKSVFHMTEMPTLLSGPYFGRVNPYNDGEPCSPLVDVLNNTQAEFRSFVGKCGFDLATARQGTYEGTLFRFPLRSEKSELCDTLYGEEKIKELFRMLEEDVYMNLLFLKSLVSIEVYVREPHDESPEGVCQFSMRLKEISIGLDQRQLFFKNLGMTNDEPLEEERRLTYRVEFETSADRADQTFIVSHYYNGKKESNAMRKLLEDPNFSYLPLVSVAMPIGAPKDPDVQPTVGQLFCFLPLPLHDNTSPTGLPVHVNSFFVVSSNRSEIKWPTTGQNVDRMTKDLQWNRCLITELLPKAYMHLLQDATTHAGVNPHDMCRAFPDLRLVNEKWRDTLLPPFLKQVHTLPIFPTSGLPTQKYVCLRDAVICPPFVSPEVLSVIIKFLVDAKKNPVCLPAYVMKALSDYSPQDHLVEMTPQFLCDQLKKIKTYQSYTRAEKLHLLQYLLSEPDEIAYQLNRIQLLPLANQKFAEFDDNGVEIYIATEEERNLLPVLKQRFLSDDLDPGLTEKLENGSVIDYTQLTKIAEGDVLKLLAHIFPRVTDKVLKLKPGNEPALGYLTSAWCKKLWHFFNRISDEHPDHLDKVSCLNILPIVDTPSDFQLSRLSGGAVCVAASVHNETLPDLVSEALPHLGIHVLHEIPDVIRHHPFIFEDGFVHQSNPHSVAQALVKLHTENKGMVNTFNSRATIEQRRALLQFLEPLALGSTVSGIQGILRDMKLFETIEGSGHKSRHQASVTEVPIGLANYRIPVKPKCQLLDLSNSEALVMAKFIGVNVLTETSVFENYILADIEQRTFDEATVRKVMMYILHDFNTHSDRSQSFRNALQNVAFLEDGDGHYRRPSELFDPSDSLLTQLFWGENQFPTTEYQECLEPLRHLGLKKRNDVSIDDLCHSAVLVQRDAQSLNGRAGNLGNHKVTELRNKSCAIGKVFLEDPSMKTGTKYKRMGELEWVPVLQDKPTGFPEALAWNPKHRYFEKPNSITLTANVPAVASSTAVIDPSFVPDKVVEAICGVSVPSCEKVMEHLCNIANCYSTPDKPTIMGMVKAVYTVLQGCDLHEVTTELSELRLAEWVWQGDGFTSPECVMLNSQFTENLTPYAFPLPRELEAFSDWLSGMGVKEECNPVSILHRIKEWHEQNGSVSTERVTHDRSIAVTLLNRIVQTYPRGVPESIQSDIVLPVEGPDSQLSLLPAPACTYHDKLGEVIDVEQIAKEDDEILHLLHRSISKATATALGVATMMNRLLEGDCEGFECIEGHGQQESLTDRIKHLLQDYPDGLAIPKELIQNADDANATTIKFLFDERENGDAMTGLLDEGMQSCQGPALWIYNDKEFADADLANIRKISGGTKEEQKDKIGRFGLGFNAVYNVTDVPSFLTREYVVYFDPHRVHLGKSMPRNDTGLKINLCSGSSRGAEMRKQLFNQFKPYHGIFGCQMMMVGEQRPYPGTLFRLPLRKGTDSEIKNTPYSREGMAELMQLLLDKADELLLFTQNVKTIEVYHLPRDASDPNEAVMLYSAERNTTKTLKQTGGHRSLLEAAKDMNPNLPRQYPAGLHKAEAIVTTLTCNEATSTSTLGLHGQSRTAHWLVFGSFGLGKSFTLALKSRSEVPVAGVAVKFHKDGDKNQPIALDSAPVYCHLPLPSSVKSGLPIIVNGCFAVKPDRRHLVQQTNDDIQNAMNTWNKHLQEDPITEAYIGALEVMTLVVDPEDDLYTLWPSASSVDEQFRSFLSSFYSSLVEKTGRWSPKIFTNGRMWVDFQHAVFLDEVLMKSALKPVALRRLQVHLDKQQNGRVAIDLPEMVRAELWDLADKTVTITDFFKDAIFPYIKDLDSEERDKLLLFGLKRSGKNASLKEAFEQSRCIPLQPNGEGFTKPRDLVSPNGQCAPLFEVADNVFPTEKFCTKAYLGILENLGMKGDQMNWEAVIERAESVQSLPIDKSTERTQRILDYIVWKHELGTRATRDLAQLQDLKDVKFLPALARPKDYPESLPWKGDQERTIHLVASADMYLPKHKNLIGSTCLFIDEDRSGLWNVTTGRAFIEKVLGLHEKDPSVTDTIKQLQNVTEVGHINEWVKDTCSRLYSYLSTCCNVETEKASDIITRELANTKCILVDDCFMHPHHCAFMFLKEIPPFISKVPYQLAGNTYKRFLTALQVKDSFEPTDFIDALHRIRAVGANVKMVREVAESLHTMMKEKEMTVEELIADCDKEILLPAAPEGDDPDDRCQLLPVTSLCLNLYPWLKKPVMDQDLRYVHPAITPEVAKNLGVKTDGENIFETLGDGFGEPFGQREKITTRIRNILEGYPCNEGILKELLQNADDAGASELKFILDTEPLNGEKIFHEKWKEMQGPALCVFNNKPFTKADLKGISELGQGSKSRDTTKTGQYGVGFNCVYHLTDVPSFMADVEGHGRTLCFFDPNCRHVPGACEANPGRLVTGDKLANMRDIFPDMCKGYREEMFAGHEGATMFRLPLRTASVAESSEISEKVITVEDVESLMETFKDELFNCLLFVSSVRCVSIGKTSQGYKPYTVTASMSGEDEAALSDYKVHVKQIAKEMKMNKIQLKDIKYREVVYTLNITDTDGRKETWSVCQCIGFKDADVPDVVENAVATGDMALLPRGGSAYCREKNKQRHRLFCFLPLPVDTALPVHLNGHFSLDQARRTLLDDIEGRTSGYKKAWNTMLMEQVIPHAYIALLSRECSQLTSQQELGTKEVADFSNQLTTFYSMFPDMNAELNTRYIQTLCQSFYNILKTSSLKCLSVQIPTEKGVELRWFSVPLCVGRLAFFDSSNKSVYQVDHAANASESEEQHATSTLGDILCRLGFNLLAQQVPRFIYTALHHVGADVAEVEPSHVLNFLYRYLESPCKLKGLPMKVKNTPFKGLTDLVKITKYCFSGAKEGSASLKGLPLCATKDEYLRVFQTETDLFGPRFSSLVPQHQDQFMNASVYEAIPRGVLQIAPCCVQQLGIEKLVPFLRTGYSKLLDEYRWNWDPQSQTGQKQKRWIQNLWKLIRHDTTSATDDKLRLLDDLCIVPTTVTRGDSKGYYLYPLKNARHIVDTNPSAVFLEGTVQNILKDHGVPILEISSCGFPSESIPPEDAMPRNLVSNVRDARGILKALSSLSLHQESSQQLLGITRLPSAALVIMKFFSQVLKDKCTMEEAEQLLSLPVHQVVSGRIVSLQDSYVYLVPRGIPRAGLDNWYQGETRRPEKFITVEDEDIHKMYKNLGSIEKTKVDLYAELILNIVNFQQFFNDEERLEHLRYVRDEVLPRIKPETKKGKKEKKVLIAALTSLPFLTDETGEFKRAGQFFNPGEPLFKVMEKSFPPRFFHTESWLEFLGQCGLHYKVTGADVVKYARQIEEGKKDENTETKAILICQKLTELAGDKAVLFQLKDVKFLPLGKIGKPFAGLYPQYQPDEGEYISFQESVFYSDFKHCWTVAKVLPKWLDKCRLYQSHSDTPQIQFDQDTFKALEIKCPLPADLVASHCRQLCRHLAGNPNRDTGMTKIVMDTQYSFLTLKHEEISQSNLDKLSSVPMILVDEGKQLVCPNQVVGKLPTYEAIKPYLYVLPVELMKYVDIFKKIGMKMDVDCSHFMNVLKLIREECTRGAEGVTELDPKQLEATENAIVRFFIQLKFCEGGAKRFPRDSQLFLLSKKRTLELSSKLVKVDRVSWDADDRMSRVQWPYSILRVTSRLLDAYAHLSKLPQAMQPKLLTDLVEEDIDESCLASMEDVAEEDALRHTDHINSDDFRDGLNRILRQELDAEDDFETHWSQLLDTLGNITFHAVDGLKTVLKMIDSGSVLENSAIENKLGIFIKAMPDEGETKVFIEKGKADVTKEDQFIDRFIDIVVCTFPKAGEAMKNLLRRLCGWNAEDISNILDAVDIRPLSFYEETILPSPGETIARTLHGILKQDIGTFEENEIVGFKTVDPLAAGGEGAEQFVYAKVLERTGGYGDGDAFQMYKVDIGTRTITVFASNIYKFHRERLTSDEMEDIKYDFDEISGQLSRDIAFAFRNLQAKDRGAWIVRTISRWQPDNNRGHETICTQILRFIEARIEEQEAMDDDAEDSDEDSEERKNAYNMKEVFEYTAQRAKENREHIEEQRKWLESNSKMSKSLKDPVNYDFFRCVGEAEQDRKATDVTGNAFYDRAYTAFTRRHKSYSSGRSAISLRPARVPVPKPDEAKRWLRQAELDLEASKNDGSGGNQAYEWAIFKCLKAAEKALKAAYYTKDSDCSTSQDLATLAKRLNDSKVNSMVDQIAEITGPSDGSSLQYPARGLMPRDRHGEDKYRAVHDLTKLLLRRLHDKYFA